MTSPSRNDASTVPAAPVPASPVLAVVVLCFGGLAAALTQTLVIPIQSELPTLLGTSAANAVVGHHHHPARRRRLDADRRSARPTCSASSGCSS